MRQTLVLLAFGLSACASAPGGEEDDAATTVVDFGDRGPCDVYRYTDQCHAAGFKTRYGIAWGCRERVAPYGEVVHFMRCVDAGDFKCCD